MEFTFPKSGEGEMQVAGGELISGVLDKAVFGKFGLVHAVQVRACSVLSRAGERRGLALRCCDNIAHSALMPAHRNLSKGWRNRQGCS